MPGQLLSFNGCSKEICGNPDWTSIGNQCRVKCERAGKTVPNVEKSSSGSNSGTTLGIDLGVMKS